MTGQRTKPMQSLLQIQVPNTIKKGWENSPIRSLCRQSGQFKNKIGAEIVATCLTENGITCSLTNNGNISFDTKYITEIRTSFASINGKSKTFWFNQIRPNLDNWTHLHLVCVHPEKIEVFEYTRGECLELCMDASGLDHIGQDGDLLAISVVQNDNKGSYWKLDCYGKKIAEFSTDLIKLNFNETE